MLSPYSSFTHSPLPQNIEQAQPSTDPLPSSSKPSDAAVRLSDTLSSQAKAVTEKIQHLLQDQQTFAFEKFPDGLRSLFLRNDVAALHLTRIIVDQCAIESDKCHEKIHQWVVFSIFAMLLRNKSLVHTLDYKIFDTIFLQEGICTGLAVEHIMHLLNNPGIPLTLNPLMPLKPPIICKSLSARAYPYGLKSEQCIQLTAKARFFQAAYELAQRNEGQNFCILPKSILEKHNVQLSDKIPDPSKDKGATSLSIKKLAEKLKLIKGVGTGGKHLLALSSNESTAGHALAFQAAVPYHIMDPIFGVIEFETFDELVLGLTCYVHYIYPNNGRFRIAEFQRISKVS